jgi:hypothetical protein
MARMKAYRQQLTEPDAVAARKEEAGTTLNP